MIGVSKDYADSISPLELYPDLLPERTLREVIGDMRPLKTFGEIDPDDIYHAFRIYPEPYARLDRGFERGTVSV